MGPLSISLLLFIAQALANPVTEEETAPPVEHASEHYLRTEFEENEEALLNHILRHSNVRIRPRASLDDKTDVNYGVTIIGTRFKEEADIALGVAGFSKFMWRDHRLAWDPADYSNITQMHVPVKDIWHPDIVIYNSVEVKYIHSDAAKTIVYSNGNVLWVPAFKALTMALCSESTPTKRVCHMTLGSWTYSKGEIDPTGSSACDVTEYYLPKMFKPPGGQMANNWLVSSCEMTVKDKYYPCCTESYPQIKVTMTFERGPDASKKAGEVTSKDKEDVGTEEAAGGEKAEGEESDESDESDSDSDKE